MRVAALLAMFVLASCQPGNSGEEEAARYDGIDPQETLHFAGNEPFWGGEVAGGTLTYQSFENQGGTTIEIERFAGNNGLGFSGELDGRMFDMAVTPGACSDGMSDRIYPFVVTVRLGDEIRSGCGWTGRRPFKGPEMP